MGIASFLAVPEIKANVVSVVGDKDAQAFISSVVSAVQTNPNLAECTNNSILSAALLGHSLKLPQSPQLGYFFLVPYDNTKKVVNPQTGRKEDVRVKEAVFQISYKGMVQLALRSGQYRKISAVSIKEGELVSVNPITEEYVFNPMLDYKARAAAPTIGYYAFIEMTSGFRKEMYWSKELMEAHAAKYSKSYRSDKKYGTSRSFWSTDFDEMAYKTLLRQLISKFGVMSIELQNAYSADMAVVDSDNGPEYVDNVPDEAVDVYATEAVEEPADVVDMPPFEEEAT